MPPTEPETVFVLGTGGGIIEMDVPTRGHALERWEQALAKGDLTIVPEAHWVTRPDGSKYLVAGAPAKVKRGPRASATTAPDPDEDGGDAGDQAEA